MFSVYGDREAIARLSERLRAQRLRRNWTQAHVARLVGLSLPSYARLEKGHGGMSLNNVARVLGVLGFAERLGEVIPEVEIVSLEETIKPVPKRARVPHKRKAAPHGRRTA